MGMDGWKFLTETDDMKLRAMKALLEATTEVQADLMERNAIMIANYVGRLFK